MGILIRTARAKDQERLNAISNANWLLFYPALVGDKKVRTVIKKRLHQPFRFSRSNANRFVWVTERNSSVIGFVVARKQKKTGWVRALYVDPHQLNRRIGSQLLNKALRELKKKGCQKAIVETLFNNSHALAFYAFHGFRKAKTRTHRMNGISFKVRRLTKKL